MPNPITIKSGLVQSVTPSQASATYISDSDGTETAGGDFKKALVDAASPLTIANAGVAAYDGGTAFGVTDTDLSLDG